MKPEQAFLQNYHGSIDSTALMLAFRAGAEFVIKEAEKEANQMAILRSTEMTYGARALRKFVERIKNVLKTGGTKQT